MRRYVCFTIFDDIEIDVTDGVATVRGLVIMPFKSREIAGLTSRVDGVQNVIDKVEALPALGLADQIRYAIASRLYNDPMFWHYATQLNPPIHIIVQHGWVTLTGVASSEAERRKAEFVAREVVGGVQRREQAAPWQLGWSTLLSAARHRQPSTGHT